MNYAVEDIVRQLSLAEDSKWKFKQIEFTGNRPTAPSRKDLADEIAAFANADGGVFLCSVTDDGEVLAMSRDQLAELESLLVEVSSDSIKPPVRIRTHNKKLQDDRKLLLVEVPRGDYRHESPGGSCIRAGSSKRKMSGEEQLRPSQKRSQARFRCRVDEQTVPNTGFRTLDESLWKPLLSAEGAADPELALEKLSLLRPDEAGIMRCTVAGVLLCAENPERWLPGARITATRYRGNDRASGQVDSRDITGPLNRQVAAAVAFVILNMRVAARKEPGRVDLPQYSDKAVFEALVNAAAHRDYSIHGSKIRLSMFEDRLEIQSPGSLPNNLTADSMAMRQATRNEVLASVLGRMSVEGIRGSENRQYFMERRGDGVTTIMRETQELCGKLPEYEVINESEVRLAIPAASQEQTPATVVVVARCAGQPLAGVNILALFPNKTWKQATTDGHGEAHVELHSTHLPMTVFAAAAGLSAHVERGWVPAKRALSPELDALPDGGAVIFPEATGYLPGLKGRLNPIRDALDRTYIYASNIFINEGKQQPVHFIPGEEMLFTDAEGNELRVRIVDIIGRSALVEYRRVK